MNIQLLNENLLAQSVVSQKYISYHNIYKATRVIKHLVKAYCPIYDISLDDFFNYYPLLAFIEAMVYQNDVEVEAAQANKTSLSQISPWNSKKEVIQSLLKELNLEHPTILNALEKVGEFFELETQLMASDKVTHADVKRLGELRSCDIRTLHYTLIHLSGKTYRPEMFELLAPREVIFEIIDDIHDYRKDVAAGHYNTYWMFEKLYGEEAPHQLQAEIKRYRNLFEERLKLFPENEQKFFSERWSRVCQRNSFLESADLIRNVALQGDWKKE
ncbi:hypothetical protein [Scytonema sp. NUACC26]|uniref:hypothetical protein n=1 Tax=Scytonema sp. NUACC26 TaxID=3140176 RepID=UPI0034DC98A8